MQTVFQGLVGSLHVIAAVVWVGSIIYHQYAVRPALKPLDAAQALSTEARITRRFAWITWAVFAVLAVTGIIAVISHLEAIAPLTGSPAGWALIAKLALAVILGVVFVLQLYTFNPKARGTASKEQGHGGKTFRSVISQRSLLFKIYIAVGLAVIISSVALSGLLRL